MGVVVLQYERRMTAVDSGIFGTLDALLDKPFAIGSVETDPEGRPVDLRILRVSSRLAEVAGFEGAEGHTIREIAPGVEPGWIDLLGQVAIERRPLRFTQGTALTGHDYEVAAAPLGPPGCFVVTFRDATERQSAKARRAAALDHAEHLLKELSHRVMNSFAAISAIVAMEGRAAPPEGRAALQRVQGRVQALAALYRRLDGAPEMDRIDAGDYLAGNVQSFRESLAAPAAVTIAGDLAPLTLPTRAAVPLALILNELLTNAVKHAFVPGRPGIVRVSLAEEGGLCRLCVADDGQGMAEGVPGVGRGLVDAFVAELGGELAYETGPGGTSATVTFRA